MSSEREQIEAAKREWEGKLKGKKFSSSDVGAESTDQSVFTKRDLPESHRVVRPGQMVTMDFYPERVNVHINEEDVCTHVTMG